MKKVAKILVFVFLIFVVIMIGVIIYLQYGLKEVNDSVINNVNLANIEDGTYQGEYNGYRWSNKVLVTVKDHKITEIKILDDVMIVKEGLSQQLFQAVIENQSLEIDTISGATVSSKAYLKAIEDALNDENEK